MRAVLFFLAAAGVWLVVSGRADFGFDRVDENAPNWGDVAGKIGELATERDVLRQGIEAGEETPAR